MLQRTPGVSGFHPDQASFFFMEDADAEMHGLWNVHFAQAEERLKKQRESAKKRVQIVVATAQTSGWAWSVDPQSIALEVPLGRHLPSDLDVQAAVEESTVSVPTEVKPDSPVEWTDNGIRAIHEAVLTYSLQILHSKGNAGEKKEILEWIWSDDVYCFVTRLVRGVHQQVPIRADQIPFTFQTCCRLSGLDFEELREGLEWELRSVLPQLGFQKRN